MVTVTALPFDTALPTFPRAKVQSAELTDEVLVLHQRKYFSSSCIEKPELITVGMFVAL